MEAQETNYLFDLLEEQKLVQFTGKINVLDKRNKQLLGILFIKNGELFSVGYKKKQSLKAFFTLISDLYVLFPIEFMVEPEVLGTIQKNIPFPLSVLKNKTKEVISQLKVHAANQPPLHLKIFIKPEFIEGKQPVTGEEFQVLCAISDWNKVSDIYDNCALLDYEITNALVTLRQKKALKVIGPAELAH
jgi:hypothetical protein